MEVVRTPVNYGSWTWWTSGRSWHGKLPRCNEQKTLSGHFGKMWARGLRANSRRVRFAMAAPPQRYGTAGREAFAWPFTAQAFVTKTIEELNGEVLKFLISFLLHLKSLYELAAALDRQRSHAWHTRSKMR